MAVTTPLLIGFGIPMDSRVKGVESISVIYSVFFIVVNFRTQLLVKGRPTLELRKIFQSYRLSGLWSDALCIIPLNLCLAPAIDEDIHTHSRVWLFVRALLRAVRTFGVWRAVILFGRFEVKHLRNNRCSLLMQVLRAVFYIYFLGHFLACTWFFMVSNMEKGCDHPDGVQTWIDYNELRDERVLWQYLRSIYTVFNIVCSVGYGDMFPMTDFERSFFTLLITCGDLLFALAFGLITRITFQMSLTDETRHFKDKIYQIQEFMNSINLDQAQQRRVEQYFAYEYK